MSGIFDAELRDQLAGARRAETEARAAGAEDGARAYAGRADALRRIADRHGIALPPDRA
ncbi:MULTISPECIES: hypothetical protein [Kitasatospora]|uniref:Uncharacterized protein n=1 Tax=Kitasatospora setae (strain ATCC 33774 / DSM 43861 / JCM 3304 / KCC A-0304 / NBRC 14216 / KM-6054) TaxID=452652 RepID=E4NFU6_KITSK|nr:MULTISPECIES: hypothetical protein [Kitasatospora]BAJ30376.1 hypothetical protein KSE_45950 [Kitasatospora setae KM-6054]